MANVQPGQRVLIHAAAGGVGHFAVQIARSLGANVIGTASAPKHDLLRELGADELIDYHAEGFEKAAEEVGVVIDLIGGDYAARSLRARSARAACSSPLRTPDSWRRRPRSWVSTTG
jgi:NADPH:quinone reductase-like Zn-dependent oxidoreductase